MNAQRLIAFFDECRARDGNLVLATVVDTGGSTYSKRGDLMLINDAGEFCGMLSGGCLEGDLVERSRKVLEQEQAELASYDLSPDDELWGLGVGCEGTMRIYLQALRASRNFEPFSTIKNVLAGRDACSVSLSDVYTIDVEPYPSLLVMGAGPDSEPLARLAVEMGWRCVVTDHRSGYVDSRDFGHFVESRCGPAELMSHELDLTQFDLALVMSHHLVSDRSYLQQLADTEIGYVGLLGPPSRRDRLLKELGESANKLSGRLRAPAGIQLGGRGPGPIAVEIIAEMQRYLANR